MIIESTNVFPFWRIAEKDKQLKQTEDSLASEHDHLASKEEELKVSSSPSAVVFYRTQVEECSQYVLYKGWQRLWNASQSASYFWAMNTLALRGKTQKVLLRWYIS